MILTNKYKRKGQVLRGTYTLLTILLVTVMFSQKSIIASGTNDYTIGETFPIMQSDMKQKEVSLSIPKYDYLIEEPKKIIKKKTLFERLIEFIKKLINK